MDRELTPDEIRELLPAYAIDAVDDDERAAVDELLAVDADTRDEVVSLQRAASFLSHTGGPPPPGVWERLEATIHETARDDDQAPPPPRLVPVSAPERRRRPDRWRWLAAAAAIVAVAFFSLWIADRGSSGPAPTAAALARAANDAPGAQHAILRDDAGDPLARAVVLPDGTGYVTTARLPELGPDRTYQLWGVSDHATISLGVMGRDPKVVSFHAGAAPSALAITNERAGGVVSSDESPTAVGDLRA